VGIPSASPNNPPTTGIDRYNSDLCCSEDLPTPPIRAPLRGGEFSGL
jgi:hypothetical protein